MFIKKTSNKSIHILLALVMEGSQFCDHRHAIIDAKTIEGTQRLLFSSKKEPQMFASIILKSKGIHPLGLHVPFFG